MSLPQVIVYGRLTEDPEVKDINSSKVLNYRVAANARKQNEQGEWVDAATTYLDGSYWGEYAASLQLKKGDAVVINGELKQRSYETKDGDKRTVYEISTDSIAKTK